MDTIYDNVFEMMRNRHYSAEKQNKSNIENEDFNITFTNNYDSKKKIFIFKIHNAKVGINHVKAVIQSLNDNECTHALIIHTLVVTSFARQFIETSDYKIELFNENELIKNITKHYLVPKHKLLKEEEVKLLIDELQISPQNLPKMRKNDPISRYYCAQVNDVFEITRYDNSIKTLYYRIVY